MHLKTLGDLLKSAGYTPKDGVAAGQIEKIEIQGKPFGAPENEV